VTPRFCTHSLIVALLSAGLAGCLPSKDPYVYNIHTMSGRFPSESPHLYNVHTVTPGVLIRGGQPSRLGLRELRDDFGVTTVVNFNDLTNKSEAKYAERIGLNYLPLRDNPFEEAGDRELHLAFLKTVRNAQRDGGGPVFIHCKTGSDRAGLAVAIYRVVECGWDTPRALDELRRYQPYYMAVFFSHYPAILRDVEQHRDEWRRQLDEMPDPPIQRPPQEITQAAPTTQRSG
jgi:protein tyrosine/serine phosphatase